VRPIAIAASNPCFTTRGTFLSRQNDTPRGSLDDLRIDVVALDTGERKTLINGGYAPHYLPTSRSTGHLVFIRQGRLFAVPFDPDRREVRGAPTPLLKDIGDANPVFDLLAEFVGCADATRRSARSIHGTRFSPDGARLAYTAAGNKGGDLWVYDLRRDAPTQLTFTSPGLREVAWSPDSKYELLRRDPSKGAVI